VELTAGLVVGDEFDLIAVPAEKARWLRPGRHRSCSAPVIAGDCSTTI
jgi:hypothetical protein